MGTVSDSNKKIARALADLFGGKPRVITWWDDNHESSVGILHSDDQPWDGITSYGTIGLSDAPLIDDGEEYPLRLEFVGACRTGAEEYESALSTSAFNIINSQEFCYPGRIFPDVLAMYNKSLVMKHFIFVDPFLWDDRPQTMELPDKKVAFLHAVPISNSELEYARENGAEALTDLFVDHQIDTFDLSRQPVA